MLEYEFHPYNLYPYWLQRPIPDIPRESLRQIYPSIGDASWRRDSINTISSHYQFTVNVIQTVSAAIAPYAGGIITRANLRQIEAWLKDYVNDECLICSPTTSPDHIFIISAVQVRFWNNEHAVMFKLAHNDVLIM